jgi:hypothetical protein
VLFFGRRVYWRLVVVLVVALRQQRPCSTSVGSVCRLLGVAPQTVARWMRWFLEVFPASGTGKRVRGFIGLWAAYESMMATVLTLVGVCSGCDDGALAAVLSWLACGATGPPAQFS